MYNFLKSTLRYEVKVSMRKSELMSPNFNCNKFTRAETANGKNQSNENMNMDSVENKARK